MIEIEHSRLVEDARRDVLLYRILSGKLDFGESYIREPTKAIKEKGLRIYYDVIKDCNDVLSDRDIFLFLIETKQWSFEEQKKLDSLPKEIENSKVNYFSNYYNPAIKKQYKIEIDHKREMYSQFFLKRNKYKNLTAVGIATGAMWFEMIGYMYKGSDKLAAINHYNTNDISEDSIRNIARSDEWLSFYSASKNVFGRPAIKMTESQRRLLTWTHVYKNCHSNPDHPSEEIFADNDAFDGWLISEKRKDKVTKKIETNSKGILPNAKNVYLFGQSKEDLEEIKSYNSPEALRNIDNEFK